MSQDDSPPPEDKSSDASQVPEHSRDWRDFPARYRQQIVGFLGWFALASAMAPFSFGLITFPGTLICLFLLARSKQSKGIAGGILIALSLNFVASLVRGLSLNAFCFIPFYYY